MSEKPDKVAKPDRALHTRMARAPFALMYHSVDTRGADPYQVTVSPGRFQHQMRVLRRFGLRGVSMAELLRAHATGQTGLVGLTFDDGYADFTRNVLPVLDRHGFTATLFVVAGRMGGRNDWDEGPVKPLLSAAEVRAAAAAGVEIGSHGLRHRRLSRTSGVERAAEVWDSREILRRAAGVEVTGFCYPYGDRDDASTQAVREAGYDYACATWATGARDRHALPRTYVGERDGRARLLAKRLRHHLAWEVGAG